MNIIKRTYHRLTGVLGYDYQGKPLRKGDLVEPAPGSQSSREATGQMTILRQGDITDTMRDAALLKTMRVPYLIMLNANMEPIWAGSQLSIRKVPKSELKPHWENVERATGWKPQVREVEHG